MKLNLKRFASLRDYTKGILYVNDEFECFTLEDEYRAVKVYGETRIPDGTYEIVLRTEGTHHINYTKKFGKVFHKGMLYLKDVPNFQWILIHIGNTDRDTAGCILVGSKLDKDNGTLLESTRAYKDLYPQVSNALLRNEKVTITIETLK
ncbi:MAG: hypothetical protein KC800_05965 [Candidatus Eremiobacteraeota bacterium]|nr:hypothetical protein [Candidatus Eremiobacteraeota bacterium]